MSTEDDNSFDWMAVVAERKIVEAIDLGVFDNLPGRGKPLELEDDPLTPAHLRIAHHVLRNAKVLPDWVYIEKEIAQSQQEVAQFLAEWDRKYATAGVSLAADFIVRKRSQYQRMMKETNDLILKHNLMTPFVSRAPIPYRIKHRLAEWDERYQVKS